MTALLVRLVQQGGGGRLPAQEGLHVGRPPSGLQVPSALAWSGGTSRPDSAARLAATRAGSPQISRRRWKASCVSRGTGCADPGCPCRGGLGGAPAQGTKPDGIGVVAAWVRPAWSSFGRT